MEKCHEIFHAYDHYAACTFYRKSSGWNHNCRNHFYVGWCGEYVAWMAIIYVVVNLITDIIYHYLDPRVRLGGDQA